MQRQTRIQRQRLIDHLNTRPVPRITLITAPTGYGKTVFARQWASTRDFPSIYVAVPRSDKQISLIDLVVDGLGAQIPSGTSPLDHISRRLTLAARHAGSVALLIDDIHWLESDAELAELSAIMSIAPSGSRIILIGRNQPNLPLARLIMSGDLLHLTARELSFTNDEIIELGADLGLDAWQAIHINSRFHGWIAGLPFLLISHPTIASAETTPHLDKFIDSLAIDRNLIDYFEAETLATLSDELRTFVLETASLPWLDAELSDATRGTQTSNRLIGELATHDVFVESTIDANASLIYHPIFAACMNTIAQRTIEPETRRAQLAAAANFLITRDVPLQTLDLALASGDRQTIIDAARAAIIHSLQIWRGDDLRDRLIRIPRDILLSDDYLAFHAATQIAWGSNDVVLMEIVKAIEPTWSTSDDPTLRGYYTSLISEHVYLQGDTQKARDLAMEAIGILPETLATAHFLIRISLWNYESLLGNDEISEFHYRTALKLFVELDGDYSKLAMYIALHRAENHAIRNNLHDAMRIMDSLDLPRRPSLRYYMDCMRAAILLEWQQGESAVEAIQSALAGCRAYDFTMQANCPLFVALIMHLAGDEAAAKQAIAFEHLLLHTTGGDPYARRTWSIEALIWLNQGQLEQVRDWTWDSRSRPSDPIMRIADYDPRLTLLEYLAIDSSNDDIKRIADEGIAESRDMSIALSEMRFLAWRAVAEMRLDDSDAAVESLRQALQIGRLGTSIRSFHIANSELVPLLQAMIENPDFDDLAPYIRTILERPRPFARSDSAVRQNSAELGILLTPREQDVLDLLSQGFTNQQIGNQLFIAERTIKKHVANIYRKLEVNNRTGAINAARHHGLLNDTR